MVVFRTRRQAKQEGIRPAINFNEFNIKEYIYTHKYITVKCAEHPQPLFFHSIIWT